MSGYGCFARYYDALTNNVNYTGRADYFNFMIRRYGGNSGSLLLDLACGTGNLSLELAALGYEVIGVDASADMLAVARQKQYTAPREILFLQQKMEELDLYGTVGITVCALDSLNHLPDEEALEVVFQKVSLFTEPGGLFLFDVNTPYKHREILGNNIFIYEPEGLYCVWQNTYNIENGRVDMALDFFEKMEDGRYIRHSEQFSERIFSGKLLEKLLVKTGFEILEILGDDGFDPPGDTTQRNIYVAKKL